ncbi:MAG: PUR family DNA/RNA-binding protein [Verrucomicrobiae bacterium]|nr:PUR family DNA/RNA-binding protein [Verrucomicrobiae bacterium]
MISNERPSPYQRPYAPRHPYSPHPQKPHVPEETLCTEKLQVERKSFIFTLKENARGRFLRITEDVNGRRDNIIVPSSGLEEFRQILDRMVTEALNAPPTDIVREEQPEEQT